jgi:hypothetical protein
MDLRTFRQAVRANTIPDHLVPAFKEELSEDDKVKLKEFFEDYDDWTVMSGKSKEELDDYKKGNPLDYLRLKQFQDFFELGLRLEGTRDAAGNYSAVQNKAHPKVSLASRIQARGLTEGDAASGFLSGANPDLLVAYDSDLGDYVMMDRELNAETKPYRMEHNAWDTDDYEFSEMFGDMGIDVAEGTGDIAQAFADAAAVTAGSARGYVVGRALGGRMGGVLGSLLGGAVAGAGVGYVGDTLRQGAALSLGIQDQYDAAQAAWATGLGATGTLFGVNKLTKPQIDMVMKPLIQADPQYIYYSPEMKQALAEKALQPFRGGVNKGLRWMAEVTGGVPAGLQSQWYKYRSAISEAKKHLKGPSGYLQDKAQLVQKKSAEMLSRTKQAIEDKIQNSVRASEQMVDLTPLLDILEKRKVASLYRRAQPGTPARKALKEKLLESSPEMFERIQGYQGTSAFLDNLDMKFEKVLKDTIPTYDAFEKFADPQKIKKALKTGQNAQKSMNAALDKVDALGVQEARLQRLIDTTTNPSARDVLERRLQDVLKQKETLLSKAEKTGAKSTISMADALNPSLEKTIQKPVLEVPLSQALEIKRALGDEAFWRTIPPERRKDQIHQKAAQDLYNYLDQEIDKYTNNFTDNLNNAYSEVKAIEKELKRAKVIPKFGPPREYPGGTLSTADKEQLVKSIGREKAVIDEVYKLSDIERAANNPEWRGQSPYTSAIEGGISSDPVYLDDLETIRDVLSATERETPFSVFSKPTRKLAGMAGMGLLAGSATYGQDPTDVAAAGTVGVTAAFLTGALGNRESLLAAQRLKQMMRVPMDASAAKQKMLPMLERGAFKEALLGQTGPMTKMYENVDKNYFSEEQQQFQAKPLLPPGWNTTPMEKKQMVNPNLQQYLDGE